MRGTLTHAYIYTYIHVFMISLVPRPLLGELFNVYVEKLGRACGQGIYKYKNNKN